MAKLKKRKDGRYQKSLILSNGKTKVVYGRTLAELEAAAHAVLQQDDIGMEVGDHTTVGEWAHIWMASYKSKLRYSTVRMYRNAYNNHIMPLLGAKELRAVRPVHIRAVMSAAAEKSESLQHKILLTMRQLFQTARQNNLIVKDPTEGIKITPHARPARKEYLSPAEAETLMQAVSEPRARAFCALCLYCGLRREEALGLQWTDIGPGRLVVSRAMTFGSNRQLPVQDLKNKASCRILPVPDRLQKILAETPRLAAYVVPAAGGADMTVTAFRRLWDQVEKAVDFKVRPHMLRHTYATTLYRAGVDLRTAQQLLGHATIQMTAQIYTHLEAEDSLAAAVKINAYLSGAAPAAAAPV